MRVLTYSHSPASFLVSHNAHNRHTYVVHGSHHYVELGSQLPILTGYLLAQWLAFGIRYNEHLGNVCTCPSNLGTGLRASVMLKLPKLYKAWGVHKLEEFCDSLGVQARGAKGEHSPPGPSGEFDISNKARIGYSEVELVQQMIDGVDQLIKLEESL